MLGLPGPILTCYAPNAFRHQMHMCALIHIRGLAETHMRMCALKCTQTHMFFGQSPMHMSLVITNPNAFGTPKRVQMHSGI